MICPRCGQVVTQGTRCSHCGCKVIQDIKYCRNCGMGMPTQSSYCPTCGQGMNGAKNDSIVLAVIGFIFSLLLPFIGLILCCVDLSGSKKGDANRPWSIAGLVISITCIIIGLFIWIGIPLLQLLIM